MLKGTESFPLGMWGAIAIIALFVPIIIAGYVGYFRRRARYRRWWTEPVMWCVTAAATAFGLVQVLGS